MLTLDEQVVTESRRAMLTLDEQVMTVKEGHVDTG